jgi:hypothetical protein
LIGEFQDFPWLDMLSFFLSIHPKILTAYLYLKEESRYR